MQLKALLAPRSLLLLVGTAFGLWCCAYIATRTDVAVVIEDLGRLSWPYVLLGSGCVFSAMACRTAKWRLMLEAATDEPRPAWFSSYSAVMVGTAVNLISPLRLDEVVRTWLFANREARDSRLVFGTVVVDKVLDIGFLAAGMGLGLPAAASLGVPPAAGMAVTAVGLVLLASPWILQAAPALIEVPVSWLPARLRIAAEPLVNGLRCFPKGSAGLLVLLFTAMEWGFIMGNFMAVLAGFGHWIPPLLLFSLIVVTGIGFMLPTTPGAVGTLEVLLGTALGAVGAIELQEAVAIAAGIHAVQLVPAAVLAMVLLAVHGLRGTRRGEVERA